MLDDPSRLFGVNYAVVIANNRRSIGTHVFTVVDVCLVYCCCLILIIIPFIIHNTKYTHPWPFWLKNCLYETQFSRKVPSSAILEYSGMDFLGWHSS